MVEWLRHSFITGTFAINTDHAASLSREPFGWMTWTPIYISLAWLGFHDIHSGIDTYMINIGSKYMDNDLNEVCTILNSASHEMPLILKFAAVKRKTFIFI